MNRRTVVIGILFTALCLSLLSTPNANSQSFSQTVTMTLKQPDSGQCTLSSLAFTAVKGTEIAGTYGSNTQISFYILTQGEFSSIQNCRLQASARPLFIDENSVGHGNPYRSLPFPANATYYFVFIFVAGPTNLASGYGTVELSFPASTMLINGATNASSSLSATSSSTTATTIVLPTSVASSSLASLASQAGSVGVSGNFGTVGAIGLVVIIAMVGSVMLLSYRKKTSMKNAATAIVEKLPQDAETVQPPPQPPFSNRLSTGYGDLDSLLVGGLPKGQAVILLSPPCDERDLLLRKIIGSALSARMPTFYLSGDPSRTQDIVKTYPKDFYALNPQADKILSPPANLYKIPSIDTLSDVNIAFTKITEERVNQGTGNRLLIFDLLTDILLLHKGVAARKWFSDFLARRYAEGFTVLAFLNPLVASSSETQTLVELFDGVIEIYEKEVRERSRRFLVIKRMFGQRYSESELMLDKNKLIQLPIPMINNPSVVQE